ncbi:hypothetical protein ACT7DH_10665 [Bacillus pacificus]
MNSKASNWIVRSIREKNANSSKWELVDFTMIQEKLQNKDLLLHMEQVKVQLYCTAGVIDEAIHESDDGSYEP